MSPRLTTFLLTAGFGLLWCAPASGQQHDSSARPSVTIDSADLRRLPLVRNSEAASFLPRTTLRLDYHPHVRAAMFGSDVRLDGVPVENFTFAVSRADVPVQLLREIHLFSNGTSAVYDRPTALEFLTAPGPAGTWTGQARIGSDLAMPGAIGSFRSEVSASGGVGGLRLNTALHAQSARSTEFNNIGDVTVYRPGAIDTAITFQTSPGNQRTVLVPGYDVIDGNELPGTNWNQLTGGARVDWMTSAAQTLFASFHYNRVQEAQFRGTHTFNVRAQNADRFSSTILTLGFDGRLTERSSLSVRIARITDERLHGTLEAESALDLDTQGDGPFFGAFNFAVDNGSFPVGEALIERIRDNHPDDRTPFPANRSDIAPATEFRHNPYGTFEYSTRGAFSGNYEYEKESRLFGSLVFSTTLAAHHLKVGGEASMFDTRGVRTGYSSPFFQRIWMEEPKLYAAFLEDELTFGRLHIQAGIRYDLFDSGAEYSETPGYWGDDGGAFVPAAEGTLAPRLAAAWSAGPLDLHLAAGRSAVPTNVYEQYSTIHADFFRFRNTNTNELFARPLEMAEESYASVEIGVAAATNLQLTAGAFFTTSDNAPLMRGLPFEDPTNPGSTMYLFVPVSEGERTHTAYDVTARYTVNRRNAVQVAASMETIDLAGTNLLGEESVTHKSIAAYALLGGLRAVPNLDVTLGLRAYSPIKGGYSPFFDGVFVSGTSWITRFDARLSHAVHIGGVKGAIWMNAYRLTGSSRYIDDPMDPDARSFAISAQRTTIGAGTPQNVIDLTSLASAGPGVRNDVDLFALQQAEARFGNGDLRFTADEQNLAFGASVDFRSATSVPLSQRRRLELGVEVSF